MTVACLGIDIGTASTKAVLADDSGAILAETELGHGVDLPAPGFVEQDAELLWWGQVVAASQGILAQAGLGPADVAALAVSGLGPCLLPCDAVIEPLRPAILYGIDTRASAEVAELTQRWGRDAIVSHGGSALSSQAVGPKILWLRRHEPDVWARTRFLHTAHSFITHRLTGEYVLDHHSASQFDPLYDMQGRCWDPAWAGEICAGAELPRLVWPGEVVGPMTEAAAQSLGLAAGTRVVAGTIDAWAEALSADVRRPGDLMIMYGSTMFLVLYTAQAHFDPAIWTTDGVFPGTQTYAAGQATSGSLMRWLCELAGLSFGDGAAQAAAIPPGAGGLLCLPYFAGERSPLFDPDARGAFVGLTLGHGPAHLIRAGYEAVAYGVRHNLEVMADLGVVPQRAVAVGGGTAGGLWAQIVSDVTGLAQELPEVTIGAAYGDAQLAAIGIGAVPHDAPWPVRTTAVTPDPAKRQAYDDGYRRYRDLGRLLQPLSHELAAVQAC